ncbi:hypothetical protein [Brevibacillus fortis]|uniref:Uncharacterized protein n=1 Tax=Brevibacillus fortis TaxID=2126352 RepID=A0A2P7UIM2_9BACL|nr:hypothetical protein [Brevibacillus fortis]PSJ86798.1 hypothetical protein C7R93_27900 [Brevibacillus fortis]
MTNNNHTKITFESTTFWGLLKIVGIKEFLSWSLYWAFILSAGLIIFIIRNNSPGSDFVTLASQLSGTLLGASAAIFGIVIAALTLTITLFHHSLLPAMLERQLLHKYLFPFWYAVALWCVNIFVGLLLIIFISLKQVCFIPFAISLELFLFLYATFYTVSLTGLVIRLALQRAQIKSK